MFPKTTRACKGIAVIVITCFDKVYVLGAFEACFMGCNCMVTTAWYLGFMEHRLHQA